MKILLIHQHFYPEPSGTARSAYELAKNLSSKGHVVTVITEFPNRNFQSFSDCKTQPKKFEVINNINVYRIKNKFKYSNYVVQRMLAYLWSAILSTYYGVILGAGFIFDTGLYCTLLVEDIP